MKRACHAHPKLFDLADALGISRTHAVGILESMWHLTATQQPHGDIGGLSDRQIARALDWPDESKLISALVDTGWLDRHSTHRLVVHNWHLHCDDAVRKAVARSKRGFSSEPERSADFVQTCPDIVGTCRDKIRLPEPQPEPEPEPEPVSRRPVAADTHRTGDQPVGAPEAVQAVNRWALASRGQELEPVRNELQRLEERVAVWADSPPIVHGGRPVSPLVLVPEAVRRIMARPTPVRFKSVAYAIASIDGELDEMRRFGSQPRDGPGVDTSRSAENAEIVARVLARRAGAAT